MNVHHLELFYHVAKSGGITAAVKSIPYGIQQPAVSTQIARLEASLDVRLFQRRPFALTAAGQILFERIAPFFQKLPDLAGAVRGGEDGRLRVAAPVSVLRDHFPPVLQRIRRRFPKLKPVLQVATQTQAEEMLLRQEIDLAVTEMERKPARGVRCKPLVELPLVLRTLASEKARSARDLCADSPSRTFISLPKEEVIPRLFAAGLTKWRHALQPDFIVGSLDLVDSYAAMGLGIGISVQRPGETVPPRLKQWPLPGFPRLIIAALWQDRLTAVASAFLAEILAAAQKVRTSGGMSRA